MTAKEKLGEITSRTAVSREAIRDTLKRTEERADLRIEDMRKKVALRRARNEIADLPLSALKAAR